MVRRAAAILAVAVLAGGCAPTHPSTSTKLTEDSILPAPKADAKSLLALDEIPPPAKSIAPRPATRPDEPAPVEALALFAAARDATLNNQPLGAIGLLQQAIALDPDSFELYRALGEAQLASIGQPNQAELNSFEKALELRPNDLRLQALVGAQYAALGKNDKALLHLRLAVRTQDYREDAVAASAVDLLLARLLEQEGYDRAALDRYAILIDRLKNPTGALRSDPDLGGLAADPQSLGMEVGALHEKHGQWALALAAYQPLAEEDSANFELQVRIVRMLSNLGRTSQALHQAAALVARFDASADSLTLLKDVCKAHGLDPTTALRQLHQANPADLGVLLALSDVLNDNNHPAEAINLLEAAVARDDSDRHVAAKLFNIYLQREDTPSAARVLVEYLARHPDSIGEIEPWWEQLLRPSRKNPLRLAMLQELKVPKSAEAARLFSIMRIASLWRRDTLARQSLEAAVRLNPPFGPAYRQLVADDWSRQDWNLAKKQKATDDLAAAAKQGGDVPLALEVRGLAALANKHPADATKLFETALASGGASPQLVLTYASALRDAKQDVKAEQLLWKLVDDRPQYDEAWESLFQFYLAEQAMDQAHKVLSQWLAANPTSVQGRIFRADLSVQEGNPTGAEGILLKVFAEHDDDPDVIASLVSLGQRTGRLEQFVSRLEEVRKSEPGNEPIVEWLVDIYVAQGRWADAIRALDETRSAVAKDADALYRMAHLYEKVNQKGTTEDVLQQVVTLDPRNGSASNDLGYSWADEGRNLGRAETMIRLAVSEEPDNESYLDSLGWVLYKRGEYAAAIKYQEEAVGPALDPDPVVLDHFGDTLYRLGRVGDAVKQWQRSLVELDQQGADREDLKDLRATLQQKLEQARQGAAVTVAPVAAET